MTTPNDGIYEGVPFDDYKTWDAWNASKIKDGYESMLNLRWFLDHPKEPTPAMIRGTNAHLRVLENEGPTGRFKVFEGNRRTKAWAEFKEEWESTRVLLTSDEWDALEAMRDAVNANDDTRVLLRGTKREVSMIWTCPKRGIRYKARIDIIGDNYIADYKTTQSIEPHKFGRVCADMLYDLQMGHYHEGYRILSGRDLPVRVLAQMQKPPYDCGVFTMPAPMLAMGIDKRERIMDQVEECGRTGKWPGIASGLQEIVFPEWAVGLDDVELDMEGCE